jgi:hypothetical protein
MVCMVIKFKDIPSFAVLPIDKSNGTRENKQPKIALRQFAIFKMDGYPRTLHYVKQDARYFITAAF